MITEEQIKEFDESLEIGSFGRAENIRECLEEYEQSKWIKFDPQDESTWPKSGDSVLVLIDKDALDELDYEHKAYFSDFFTSSRTCYFDFDVYHADECGMSVTHWQPLPEPLTN